MRREDVVEKLKDLIESQSEIVVTDYDKPLDIDSYLMMLIITFVEEEMGVQLDMDKLDFDDFKSLNTFADMILGDEKAA